MSPATLHLSAADAHSLWAPTYDHAPNPLLSLERRIVETLLPCMEGLRVLDLACGTGRWLDYLLRRGARAGVGIDLSSAMLKEATTRQGLAGRLVEADAVAIPLSASSIDFAMCSFGASYMPDLSTLAKELSRVLREHGSAVVTDFHPSAQARGWKRSFRYNSVIIEILNFARSVEEIQQAFIAEGFACVACLEPAFGEAERVLLEQAGKENVFEKSQDQAAVLVCEFTKGMRTADSVSENHPRPFGSTPSNQVGG